MKRTTKQKIDFIIMVAVVMVVLSSVWGCCPKIGETTTTQTITHVDTVWMPGEVTVPQHTTEGLLDMESICDSLLRLGRESVVVVPAVPANLPGAQIAQVVFERDTSGLFALRVDNTAYQLLIDSLRQQVNKTDTIMVEKTITVGKCDKKFHHFTVGFFWFICAVIVIFLVVKYFKII